MPPPTREQFNAAAAKVAASAPPGLSRDDFYKRIDAELAPAEPDTYMGGFEKSAGDTALRTVKGVVRGAKATLDPRNLWRGPIALGEDLMNGGEQTKASLKAIASGDPDAGGEAIGSLATGGVLGRMVPSVVRRIPGAPSAMVSAGKALENVGETSKKISPYGAMEAIIRADPRGAAVAAAPYVVKGAGTLLRKVGGALGADNLTATTGRLSTRLAPSLEESLRGALNSVKDSDTINDLPSRAGNVRPTANISQSNYPRVDPVSRGGMQATLPDKWGMTTLLPKNQEALLRELMATESFRKLAR